MANFRPLQPAPMDPEPTPQPQSRPLVTQKPKRTVTLGACVACRKRKSKCDGLRPVCTCCAQKDTECVYELGPNEKPSQAMKRKNEEMQGELVNLRQLYDFLRLRPEHEAQEILRRIRSNPAGASPSERIQELADFVRHGDLFVQASSVPTSRHEPESNTLPPLRVALESPNLGGSNTFPGGLLFPGNFLNTDMEGPSSQRRRHASDEDVSARSDSQGSVQRSISIGALLHPETPPLPPMGERGDDRLSSARNWTTVTDDTRLIVNLLKSWHRWEYGYWHFMDWDCFLDDMTSGETNFCSKLLVNAILASASFQSSVAQNPSTPFADNVITRFYKEAWRLWESEEGHDSLTRLQAAMVLYLVLGKNGRDKVGHSFLVEACRIARDLGLFRLSSSSHSQKPCGVSDERWERSRAVAAWSIFNFQLTMSFTYSFPPIIKSQPPLPIPYGNTRGTEHFRSECARQIIMTECANTVWDFDVLHSGVPPKQELVEVLYLRLKSWWDSRLEILDPAINPSPENLVAAMIHHVGNIRLVHPFLKLDSSSESVRTYHERAYAIYSSSMRDLYHLLEVQETRYGWTQSVVFMLHPITIASWGCLDELARQTSPNFSLESDIPYRTLLICLRALSGLSSYIFYAQPLFRLIFQTCQTLRIRLPAEIMSAVDRYQSKEWTINAASMVSSQYVADMHSSATDIEDRRMDTVIARWEALTIGDRSRIGLQPKYDEEEAIQGSRSR